MRTRRGSVGRLVALVVGLGALATTGLAVSTSAVAAPEHRALVIVDTGGGVTQRVVTFSEDSISGLAALQRAGADPVVYQYAGQGGAVCRLFGVGRDAGPGCLGGGDGDPRYWAYWRAPAGSSTYTYSRVGAGATTVHDGDVEGWTFSTGSAPPPYAPVPPPATSPPPPATLPPPRGGVAPGVAGAASGGAAGAPGTAGATPGSGGTAAPAGTPPTTVTTAPPALPGAGGPAAASARARARATDAPRTRSAAAVHDAGSGGPPWSLVGFGVLLAAIVGAILLVRRARRPRAPTG